MAAVFISHASADDAAVAELASDLQQVGYDVWHDDQLLGGQDWWDAILGRIRSCEVFVFALSEASLTSVACLEELSYGVTLNRPLLPVLVADFPRMMVPDVITRTQWVDYRSADKAAATRLFGGLRQLPAAPPLPQLPPVPPVPMSPLDHIAAELAGDSPLDYDRQLVIVGRLRDEAENAAQRDLVPWVIDQFRSRRDVAARIDRDLAALAEKLAGAAPPPSSPSSPISPFPSPTWSEWEREGPERLGPQAGVGPRRTPEGTSTPLVGRGLFRRRLPAIELVTEEISSGYVGITVAVGLDRHVLEIRAQGSIDVRYNGAPVSPRFGHEMFEESRYELRLADGRLLNLSASLNPEGGIREVRLITAGRSLEVTPGSAT